jgi:hypothetical protein
MLVQNRLSRAAGCPLLAVLFWLSSPSCPALAVSSWLFRSHLILSSREKTSQKGNFLDFSPQNRLFAKTPQHVGKCQP